MSIVISNSRIVDFYKKNNTLNPEEVNLWLVEMMEKILGCNEKGLAQGMMTKMEGFFSGQLNQMNILNKQLEAQNSTREFLQTSVQQINGSMGTMRDDFKNLIVSQFVDSQKDNERMIRSALEGAVEDGKQKDVIVRALTETIGDKLGQFAKDIQSPISSLVGASEKRIADALVRIYNDGIEIKNVSKKTGKDFDTYLAKYDRSKDKGNIGECKLEGLINTLYPSCDLQDTTFSGGGKGDFIMRRPGKPMIMFETKEYADRRKVPKKDVIKFLNDVKENECCGILVNHTGGITEKENFYFEFNMGKVLLYIHNANYELDKIDLAIRLIDYMDERMGDLNKMSGGGNVMSDEVMEQINMEFTNFNEYKDKVLNESREFYNNTKKNLEAMQFSCLHKFLSTKYATEKSIDYYCKSCEQGFKNNRALAAHKKSKTCKANPNYIAPVVVGGV